MRISNQLLVDHYMADLRAIQRTMASGATGPAVHQGHDRAVFSKQTDQSEYGSSAEAQFLRKIGNFGGRSLVVATLHHLADCIRPAARLQPECIIYLFG